ncbi:MAG: hypothetical protein ACK502_01705 [Alphaproteobacteria bacterium]
MKWSAYSGQQKLLVVVAASVLAVAFFVLLDIWGIQINDELMGRIVGTALVIGVVAAILIAIMSNMRDSKKDNDNFFN